MRLLEDRTCILTGGAGSIGQATARRFVDEGARVMLADLDAQALAQAAASLPEGRVRTFVADVSDPAQVQALVAATCEAFGPIDVLFSNAGIVGPIAPIGEYPVDEFDRVLAVHVRGAFLMCRYGVPAMRDGGSIVINSSVAGLRGDPGVYGYITAKHAQVGLMRAVAKEVAARGIRVNTVHPGPVGNTFQGRVEAALSPVLQRDAASFFDERIPLARHARPEEIAAAVLFLASAQSSFVTGTALSVDGGMSA